MLKNNCQFKYQYLNNKLDTYLYLGEQQIGHSTITVQNDIKTWIISAWYIDKKYQNRGYGKVLLQKSLLILSVQNPIPQNIEYIWNGANQYVMDWLEVNFNPISKCPLAIRKNNMDDDWSSHIYILNRDAVLKYFDII